MAAYTVQQASRAGIVPTYNTVASSDTFVNDGHTYLHVKNGGGSPTNVTVTSQAVAPEGTAQTNKVIAVAGGVEKVIGPWPVTAYNDSSNLVTVGYSVTTSVTAAVVSLPSN